MGRKVVILNGSPRANGNTAALVDALIKGAEGAGHTVTRFDLEKMNLHFCKGCERGGRDPKSPCVQKDDMEKVYPAYLEADVIVLASPMYYWNFSAQLKCGLDRLYAVTELAGHLPKESVLLMAAGGSSESNFAPMRQMYQALAANMDWKDRGIVYAGGNSGPGDVLNNPQQLEEARELGASL